MKEIKRPSIDTLKPEQVGSSLYPMQDITSAELERRIAILKEEVSDALDTVASLTNKLDGYIADSSVAITTNTLNTVNLITENLNTVSAILREVTVTTANIDTLNASIATLESLTAELANFDKIVTSEISADNATIEEALINALTVTDLIVQGSQTFQNLFIGNLNAGTATISEVTSETTTTNHLSATQAAISTLDVDMSSQKTAFINNLSADKAIIDRLDLGAITHSQDYITITNDFNSLIIAPPYFKNGFYQMVGIDETDTALFAIELHNDIRNPHFSWSREPTEGSPYLELVRFFDINKYPRAYFRVNVKGHTIKVYYKIDSHDTLPINAAPETYEIEPFSTSDEGTLSYLINRDNGVYFSNQVDIIKEADSHDYADLTLSSTDSWSITGEQKVYNGVTPTFHTTYRPDQSLNTNDNVKHLSVEAPFLGIADAEVNTRFKTPNIYNGPALSDTSELVDETLYIPIEVDNGTTIPGVELTRLTHASPSEIPTASEVDTYFSSSISKAIAGKSFLVDEYEPKKGYIITVDNVVAYNKDIAAINEGSDSWFNTYLLRNENDRQYYFVSPVVDTAKALFTIKATDIAITDGQLNLSAGRTFKGYSVGVYKDATLIDEYQNIFGPFMTVSVEPTVLDEGRTVYITTENDYMPNGLYTVVRNSVGFVTTSGLPFTRNKSGGRLYRKKSTNILPLIPYHEVEE